MDSEIWTSVDRDQVQQVPKSPKKSTGLIRQHILRLFVISYNEQQTDEGRYKTGVSVT